LWSFRADLPLWAAEVPVQAAIPALAYLDSVRLTEKALAISTSSMIHITI
jgi:hypothetical protein